MSDRVYLNLNDLKNRINRRANVLPRMPFKMAALNNTLKTCSLKQYANTVYDQGFISSCTSNAFCSAFNIQNAIKKKYLGFMPSRLFLYYKEREMEYSIYDDSGANVINGEIYVKKYGICSEKSWPYNVFKWSIRPPSNCDVEAKRYKIQDYTIISIDSLLINNIKSCIKNQKPVLIALALYDSFVSKETGKTGIIPMPNMTTEKCVGGHELCLIGYDDTKQQFIVQNSWGTKWGDKGFCYIPYDYLTNPKLNFECTYFTL